MLPSTEEEQETIRSYMEWQAPDLTVEFLQKIYSEAVVGHRHDVWDVHTDVDRWWVITNPTNLYSQEQFPNMDLALTFHMGLCLRIPRSDKERVGGFPIEPFARTYRYLSELDDLVVHAEEVGDYQAIGVRCREVLLAFVDAAQTVVPWSGQGEPPQRANFRGWVEHICSVALAGPSQKERRQLLRTLLESAWQFSNWLTHAKNSKWHDAEAASNATGNAISTSIASVIQHIRGVPDSCPSCGSHRLSPERGYNPQDTDEVWERPTCTKCDWTGTPVRIHRVPTPPEEDRPPPERDCVIPTVPLRKLKRPSDD